MSDDLFRARVEPRRAPRPTEAWPENWDEEPDEALDDLMASFDRHRAELDQRLNPAAGEEPPPASSGIAGIADTASATPTADTAPEQPAASDQPGGDFAASQAAVAPESAEAAAPSGTGTPAAPSAPAANATPAAVSSAADSATLPSRRVVVAPPPRRSRKPWLIAGAVLVAAAGVGTGIAALSGSPSGSGTASPTQSTPPGAPGSSAATTPDPDPATSPAVVAQAADWITANVGPGHVVACDVTVCAVLSARGFPAASLVTVQSRVSDVEQADVVVVTDVIRRQLGAGLSGVTAEEPLAVFPAGSSTVQITAVALDGPQAQAGRLAADRQTRRSAGAALLRNPKIVVTGAARAALSDGLVDSRVCTLLAVLGGAHTIAVDSFSEAGPRAGADLPLPGVVISAIDGVGAATNTPQATALKNIVGAQRPPYAPLSITPAASGPDQGLAIRFAQPSPIGLLGGTTP